MLTPLGLALQLAGVLRRAATKPERAPVPVICVGNLVAGGAGKTPVVLSLLEILAERGLKPAALTRGYGGEEAGPLQVVPDSHDAAAVGDEALLLAAVAPTWVARDRVAGAKAAAAAGAEVLVMDDGFQNPGLKKDLSLLVIDAAYGLGNGRPEKFFESLREAGAEVAGTESFADHQPYDSATLERLRAAAAAAGARLVTTAKDAARLGPAPPRDVAVLDVKLQWDDKGALLRLLERLPLPLSRTAGR